MRSAHSSHIPKIPRSIRSRARWISPSSCRWLSLSRSITSGLLPRLRPRPLLTERSMSRPLLSNVRRAFDVALRVFIWHSLSKYLLKGLRTLRARNRLFLSGSARIMPIFRKLPLCHPHFVHTLFGSSVPTSTEHNSRRNQPRPRGSSSHDRG